MVPFIKKHWKPITLLSGLGGALVGGAMLMSRSRRPQPAAPPWPIDQGVEELLLFTGREDEATAEGPVLREFRLQKTPFKVYDIMDHSAGGYRVFFVTPPEPSAPFYAVVGVPRVTKKRDLLDHLAKGRPVLFIPCHVGGSPNGVPTGQRMVTGDVLTDWEIVRARP